MNKPVYYLQNDPGWGKIPYTIDGDILTETIGKSGCGPTCMAMILATWVDPKINPIETCKRAIDLKDRTASKGTEWEYFKHEAAEHKLHFKQTSNTADAVDALKDGALVICSMGEGYFTKGGHFILAYKYEDSNIYVNDPASTARTHATSTLFYQQCKQYFIFHKPAPVAKPELRIRVNGKFLSVKPFIKDGSTMAPVRAIAEALGKKVSWDGENQIVDIK